MTYQLRFDRGRQQRYLPDRESVLRYVLAIGPKAGDSRFEVWAEGEPVRLADGSPGGRRFELTEVIDVSEPGSYDRLRADLDPGPTPDNPTPTPAPDNPTPDPTRADSTRADSTRAEGS